MTKPDRPLNGRWPLKCTSFDDMLVDLAKIMVNAARQPESSITFFSCNAESHSSDGRSGGFHWMSAVFEVIALEIAGRDGQQAAGSRRQERHQKMRARKRQKGDKERNQDCDLVSTSEEEMDIDCRFDSD